MLCFAWSLRRVHFYSRSSVGLSCAVYLIFLCGCFRVALCSVCVSSLVVLELYLLVAPLLVGSPLAGLLLSTAPTLYTVVQVLVNKAVLPDHQIYAR